MAQFPFEHDDRFALPLRLLGVTPQRAYVRIEDGELLARFGLLTARTALANVKEAKRTGPYRAYKAVGPRLSLADRGATFGTSTEAGVCILFHEPVVVLPPIPSPGLTVTVSDPERLIEALQDERG